MNVVRKTREESRGMSYTTPKTKVVLFQPEGVMCSSVLGIDHEAFTIDESNRFEL